jgi:hypothetical protein
MYSEWIQSPHPDWPISCVGFGRGDMLSLGIGRTQVQNCQRQKFGLVMIAALAIGIALLLLLAPPVHSGHGVDFVAILPLLLVAVLSPLTLLGPLANLYAGRIPKAAAMVPALQRPPPSWRR